MPLLNYIGPDDCTVSQIVAAQHKSQQRPALSKTDAIDDIVRQALENGPMPSKELSELAKLYGFSEDQLDRSKRRIGTKSRRTGTNWTTEIAETSK